MLTGLKHFQFFVFVTVISGQNMSDVGPTRYDLIHYLLNESRYDPSLPPDFYTENITTVSVELSIYDLNSESEIDMEYECTLYLRMNWTDERLNFAANKTKFDNMDLGDDVVDRIWIPDLYFHHERESHMHGLFTKNQLVYIYRNGSVLYSSRLNIKSHCEMNLTHYPFDIQKCPIIIKSYSLNADNLILEWNGDDAVRIEKGVHLENIKSSQKHSYDRPYDNTVGNFSTLHAKIKFTRPKQSFAIMYIAQPVIIVLVSLTSFLLDDDVTSRFTVPTGALTQLILQWTLIYNKLPAASEISFFDIWMLVNVIIVGLVLIINAVICHFHILKNKDKEKVEAKKADESNTKNTAGTKRPNCDTSETKSGEVFKASSSIKEVQLTEQSNRQKKNSTDEKSPLVSNESTQYGANGVVEKGATGDHDSGDHDSVNDSSQKNGKGKVVVCSYNNPAFLGPTQSSKNTKSSDAKVTVPVKSSGKVHKNELKVLKELKEDFLELLEGSGDITIATDWQAAEEIVKEDPRYKRACQDADEISQWYKEHIDEKKQKDFLCLLEEKAKTIKDWKRAEMKIDHDSRYDVVDDTEREKWFQVYRKKQCIKWLTVNFNCCVALAVAYGIFVIVFYKCYWKM